ncbi:S-methyl-5-thioribose-1-phosphate isomerase [Allohahella sp. A8]|uniref:S-methyl-5-thioribose-1-phosphate isomerase n=1 Tax=Allohahella sp. A8 TaxID=3141461 RepID=UPI003A7F6700
MTSSSQTPAISPDAVTAIRWDDKALHLLDQRALPLREQWIVCDSAAAVADAIRAMVVRGAPAIGISAAYGMVLAARAAVGAGSPPCSQGSIQAAVNAASELLAASRPTAVNLFWAIRRMNRCLEDLLPTLDEGSSAAETFIKRFTEEAVAIHDEDLQNNLLMARHGAELIASTAKGGQAQPIVTHCNTGSLATGGHGTALGVIRSLHEQQMVELVYVDETRPWMQGARLTSWELQREGIPCALIVDSAAASMMARSTKPGWVIVGADRVAANGDVVNKIGTYGLAVQARYHGWKFMVVAPTSTFDPGVANGSEIEIEERPGSEIIEIADRRFAADGVRSINPVFDVTPAALVDYLVSERGVISRPRRESIAELKLGVD